MIILIIGFGSIAKKHIKALKAIDPTIDIVLVRTQQQDRDLGEFNGMVKAVVFNLQEAFSFKPQLALITNPAPFHLSAALACVKEKVHVFIEKPLSDTLEKVDLLREEAASFGVHVLVGYCLHFFKPLQVMKDAIDQGLLGNIISINASVGQWLPNWRAGSDYRKNVTARSALGGGVILELSHELDYVRWFLGKPESVVASCAHLSALEIDVEDIAEITVQFAGHKQAHIHLDFLDRSFQRSCRIVGVDGTLVWEAHEGHRVRFFDAGLNAWRDLLPSGTVDVTQMYTAQMRHLLDCVQGKSLPQVSLEDGLTVLKMALAAKVSAEKGMRVLI